MGETQIIFLLVSGTYNNQYMIIDLKKVVLGEKIMDGALWVVEQIPTLVKSGDQTQILRAGKTFIYDGNCCNTFQL